VSAFALVSVAFSSQWRGHDETKFDPDFTTLLAMFGSVNPGARTEWSHTVEATPAAVSEEHESSFFVLSNPVMTSNETCVVEDSDDCDMILSNETDSDITHDYVTGIELQLDEVDVNNVPVICVDELADKSDLSEFRAILQLVHTQREQIDSLRQHVTQTHSMLLLLLPLIKSLPDYTDNSFDVLHELADKSDLSEFGAILHLVHTQREQIDSLRQHVTQMHSMLLLLLPLIKSLPDYTDNSFDVLPAADEEGEGHGQGEGHVTSQDDPGGLLELVEGRGRELRALRHTAQLQREQLIELKQQTTKQTTQNRCRTVLTRSSHCKRDACCGPGPVESV